MPSLRLGSFFFFDTALQASKGHGCLNYCHLLEGKSLFPPGPPSDEMQKGSQLQEQKCVAQSRHPQNAYGGV